MAWFAGGAPGRRECATVLHRTPGTLFMDSDLLNKEKGAPWMQFGAGKKASGSVSQQALSEHSDAGEVH
jgi:hypothetical protein